MSDQTPEPRFSLFEEEERILEEADRMVRGLVGMSDGVRRLAEAYRQVYNEQRRLVRLSDRMQLELHNANQQLEEKTRELTALNRALADEIQRRETLAEELRRFAVTDELTGCFTRRHLFELAEVEVKRCARHGHPLCLLAIDLDHFKRINDTYGHAAGDAALRTFVEFCRPRLRVSDIIGRTGGEEFLVVLPQTDLENALALAERLRSALDAHEIESAGERFRLSVSIGVTDLGACDRLDSALVRADNALYAAKRAGRNRSAAEPAPAPAGEGAP